MNIIAELLGHAHISVVATIACASLFAGFFDAIVGGGGLVLVPALFSAFPNASPSTLFGTGKAASTWGTAWAALQYSKRVTISWRSLIPAAMFALVGSTLGAWTTTVIAPTALRKVLPAVLLCVFLYSLFKRDLGKHHQPRFSTLVEAVVASPCALAVGFYDGFFGPGTGSFFVFLFVRVIGYDFLHASAASKALNSATNCAALALFAYSGNIWWDYAAVMAIGNIIGSVAGTVVALRRGPAFVRVVFIGVVGALILKTGAAAL